MRKVQSNRVEQANVPVLTQESQVPKYVKNVSEYRTKLTLLVLVASIVSVFSTSTDIKSRISWI